MTVARLDRTALVVVAAVTALLALPFVLSPYFIAQDLPAHIETAAQIVGLVRGDDVIAATYRLHALPWPNSLPTFLIAVLLPVVGGLAAGKLVTAAFVIAWPTSLALLFSRLGRSPWLALLAIPTCFDLSFSFGFTHFVVGKPVMALAFVAVIDLVTAPSKRRAVAVVAVIAVLFHCHLLLFAATVPLAVIVAVVLGAGVKDRVIAVVAVVVGALPGAWWIAHQPDVSGTSIFPPVSKRLDRVWQDLGDLHSGSLDAVPWTIAAIVVVVTILAALRTPAAWRTRQTLIVVGLVVACGGFTLLGPVRTPEASIIAERFTSLTIAFFVGLAPVVVGPRLRALLVVTGVVCAGLMAGDATYRWRGFSREHMGDFDDVLAAIPPGSRVATQFVRPLTSWGRHNDLWHWPKLVSLRGSHTDDTFALRDTCVLGVRPGVVPMAHPALTSTALSSWDHLLVQGSSPRIDATLRALPLTPVISTGAWRLFRIVGR